MSLSTFDEMETPQCCLTIDDEENLLLREFGNNISEEQAATAWTLLPKGNPQPSVTFNKHSVTFHIHDHVSNNNMSELCKNLIQMTLLDRTECVNVLDSDGCTALFIAVLNNRQDALKLLLQFKNIDVHIKCGRFELTAFQAAIAINNRDFMARLYEAERV